MDSDVKKKDADATKIKKEKKKTYAKQWREENPLYYIMYYHLKVKKKRNEEALSFVRESRPEGYVIKFS